MVAPTGDDIGVGGLGTRLIMRILIVGAGGVGSTGG
jgi:hypothetical protein